MPVIRAAIDPLTRIEGHLKIDVDIDTVGGVQQVVDARSTGTLFRGFEKVLEGRDPRDATIITSRICGVCPTSHALAAAQALDAVCGVTVNTEARLLRNLVHGACYVESTILHFYLLCLPDFTQGPGMAPWLPGWDPGRRIDPKVAGDLIAHYLQAIVMRRKCHEMGAIFGGKLPHTPAYIAGGFTAVVHEADRAQFRTYLNEIIAFIAGTYIPDTELMGQLYPEYFSIGRGPANLLSYGVFEQTDNGSQKLFPAGRVLNGAGSVLPFDPAAIREHVTHSWYDQSANDLHPADADTVPQHPKDGGYSWLKAPRIGGAPYECGPIARMWCSGDYTHGVSVLDRHISRAREALKIAQAMSAWLDQLTPETSAYTPVTIPDSGSAAGLTEAPRGALGHWLGVTNGKISRYQIITPTCWNLSPRDTAGLRGSVEEALVGTQVANPEQPIEVLRVVHSVDPCLDCATHAIRVRHGGRVVPLNARRG